MQVIEVTAKSLDEAKAQAAQKLGVDVDRLTVKVLEESKGLFGKSNVRISAQVSEAPAPAEKPKPAARGSRAKAKTEPVAEVEEVAAAPVVEDEVPAAEPAPARGRGRGRSAKPEPTADTPAATEEAAVREPVATDEDAARFVALLDDLMERAELEVSVQATGVAGKYVNIRLDGKDAGYLVGKHGEVLNSLQYVTNIMATQQWGNGIRAVIDGNDFRARREEQLTDLASKIAEQVIKRGEEAVLDALPAFERRLVHKALSEMPGVSTYSEGEEPNRRVVIAPAD